MFMGHRGELALIRKMSLAGADVWGKRDKEGSLAGVVVDGFLDFKDPKLGYQLRGAVVQNREVQAVEGEPAVVVIPFYDVELKTWRNLMLCAAHVPAVPHGEAEAVENATDESA
ncbi:hypothetical protein HS125_12680 [bacterium]|nr:hypothetical protein [bacterium]